jgi:hypothetical protein
MTFPITGGDANDQGPIGCVVRFIIAGDAGDNAAAAAELHPDCLANISGTVKSPPDVTAVTLEEPLPVEDRVHVPARLLGRDGTEQRFTFVVRPFDDRWGVDLNESLSVTFGGNPLEMMGDALRQAVAPLGEAMDAMGNAIGAAFSNSSGTSSSDSDRPAARRLALDEPLPDGSVAMPAAITAHLIDLDLRRRIHRSDVSEEFSPSTDLSLRLTFDLDPAWSASACLGVTITEAVSLKGEDLVPPDASPDLGSENYASWERERRELYARFSLASPQKTFTGLKVLTGTIRLSLVGGELLELALGPIAEMLGRPIPLTAFGIDVHLDRNENGNLVLRSPSGWSERMSEIHPVAATGDSLSESWSSSGDGETDTRTYDSEVPDDGSLLIRFWSQTANAEIPFTVDGLPAKLE